MTDSDTEVLIELNQSIRNGDRSSALKKINGFLESKTISKKTRLSYQILKAKALTKSDQFFQSMNILDDIEESIMNESSDYERLDFYICKIENLLIFGKTTAGMTLVEKAEDILENTSEDPSNIRTHKKIDLLILKSCMISNIHGYTNKLGDVLELCFQLCEQSKYDYGKALTLERMAGSFSERGNKEEAMKCAEEAYKIWKRIDNKAGIAYSTFLKGLFLSSSDSEQALHLLTQALTLNEELDAKLTISKIHNSLAILLFQMDKGEDALKHLEKSIMIKREIGDKHGLILLLYNMGQLYISTMENDKALSYLHEGLALTKELDYQRPYYLIQLALNNLYIRRGELNKAMKFLEEAVSFYEERNIIENIAWAREKLADILVLKGDLDNALQNYIQSLDFYEKERKFGNVCDITNNIAEVHQLKGDDKLALRYYEKGKALALEHENYFILSKILYNLISYYLDLDYIDEAEESLEILLQLNNKFKSKKLKIMADLSKALFLIKKQLPEVRQEAKELLERVLEEGDIEQKFISRAILGLCEVLLAQLRETEDMEVFKELKEFVDRLHKEGTSELAYPLLIQSIWLQANIAIMDLDVNKARRLLKSAQVMAEAKDMNNLARRISNNHDNLLSQLERWDEMTKKLPNIAVRLELTHIESVLNEMIKGKGIVYPEDTLEREDPILLSIFTKTGDVLYLKKIDPYVDDDMLEEIWVFILKNIKEEDTRSGIIERMRFSDYTYVVKRIESLIFCYIFIGHSYEGIKKIDDFSQLVYGTVEVWEELEELSKISLSTDFEFKTFISTSVEETSLEYSTTGILNQYVDNIFL